MKKTGGIVLMVGMLLLSSCEDINSSKPKNLIPEDKMVDVLTELSVLHGARSYNRALMEEKGIDPYPYLAQKFGIDSVQLVQSNEYYARNYRQYKKIYDSVKVRLENLVVEYDSIRRFEQQRNDSLRKVPGSDSLLRQKSIRRDSLMPAPMEDLPPPVSRTRMQR